MGLIIPTEYLNRELPEDATDVSDAITDAVTSASAFVNAWTSQRYLEWDAYTEDSDENVTINAPREIARICLQVAKHIYWQAVGEVVRNGTEDVDHEQRIEYYRERLENIDILPTSNDLSISLDTDGYQLIARNQNILTHVGYITSGSSNVWNMGEHWRIIKGGQIDADDYHTDGWYLDGSNEADDLEGTLTYYRSYRTDGKDYIRTFKTHFGNTSG